MSKFFFILASKADFRLYYLLAALAILLSALVIFRCIASAQSSREIGNLRLRSDQPGVLRITWDAPSDSPEDYRVSWAPASENFKTWTDVSGNAFPTSPSYAVTGLQQGVRYKVRARSRYGPGSSGPWSGEYEMTIASTPPTSIPPTLVPPTSIPPTSVPPTSVPPTSVPPTSVPPTSIPPSPVPPTSVPPTSVPPTSVPPTSMSRRHLSRLVAIVRLARSRPW